MKPWLEDSDVRLYHGTASFVCMAALEPESVQAIITSPPYWRLRDYGDPGQIGQEPTVQEYVSALVDTLEVAKGILRPDGTLWLNLGDSYAGSGWSGTIRGQDGMSGTFKSTAKSLEQRASRTRTPTTGLKEKDLLGAPWRVALALQDAGWWLRAEIIWHKPNPMPESVTDRPTRSHETIFLLAKQPRYYYDGDAIAEPDVGRASGNQARLDNHQATTAAFGTGVPTTPTGTRNARTVWTISPEPTSDPHYAVYPTEIVRRCLAAGTSEAGECSACGAPFKRQVERESLERHQLPPTDPRYRPSRYVGKYDDLHGGNNGQRHSIIRTTGWQAQCLCQAPARPQTVLDPFVGSGTTCWTARHHGRRSIGIDVSTTYLEIAARRLGQQSLLA